MEIDHIFIAVKPQAPEADVLRAFGLQEGTPNRHVGQGTANRRFFFHNLFVELLWLEDAAEAQSPVTLPTQLFARLQPIQPQVSPFGICLRPSVGEAPTVPFAHWFYQPAYLPASLSIPIAPPTPLQEPMWFMLTFGQPPIHLPAEKRQPLQHQPALQQVTSVRLHQPIPAVWSQAAECTITAGCLEVIAATEHWLELVFDHAKTGNTHDFRPHLPLVLQY